MPDIDEKMTFEDGEIVEGQEAEMGEGNEFVDPLEDFSGEGECDE